ncbi:hypothetical protein REH65_22280 [Saccharopolyspora sp. ID03-671]|uniref:hypothetical protein n=1 Tax=Saccharopolyspora sp. ID03-671 TaxID=3073066 RepID=UPI003243F085
MSASAYMVCFSCRVLIALGKPVMKDAASVDHFHLEEEGSLPNSENPLITKSLWRFLAEHAGHPLRVKSSYEPDFEVVSSFSEIGSDEVGGIDLGGYVDGWSG